MDLKQYTSPLWLLLGQLANSSSVHPAEATAPHASAHSVSLLRPSLRDANPAVPLSSSGFLVLMTVPQLLCVIRKLQYNGICLLLTPLCPWSLYTLAPLHTPFSLVFATPVPLP